MHTAVDHTSIIFVVPLNKLIEEEYLKQAHTQKWEQLAAGLLIILSEERFRFFATWTYFSIATTAYLIISAWLLENKWKRNPQKNRTTEEGINQIMRAVTRSEWSKSSPQSPPVSWLMLHPAHARGGRSSWRPAGPSVSSPRVLQQGMTAERAPGRTQGNVKMSTMHACKRRQARDRDEMHACAYSFQGSLLRQWWGCPCSWSTQGSCLFPPLFQPSFSLYAAVCFCVCVWEWERERERDESERESCRKGGRKIRLLAW